MKIESIIRRRSGTTVTFDGATYTFKPDDRGRHVAEVTNERHVARFLMVPEGFRWIKDGEDDEMPEAVRLLTPGVVSAEQAERLETDLQVANGVIDKLQDDIKSMRERLLAVEAENDTLKRRIALADNALDGEPGQKAEANEGDDEGEGDKTPAKPAAKAGKSEQRLELEAKFKDKFGRRPDKRISDEKIVQMLEE